MEQLDKTQTKHSVGVCILIIPAIGMLRQGDHKFEASLDYIVTETQVSMNDRSKSYLTYKIK